jgi:SOS-response transcriptional repressor LexA
MKNLTKKQTKLLKFFYDFRYAYGDSPTLPMVVKNVGLSSNRSVLDMIQALVATGYLEQAPKMSRSTQLTWKALDELRLLQDPESTALNVLHAGASSPVSENTMSRPGANQDFLTQAHRNPAVSWSSQENTKSAASYLENNQPNGTKTNSTPNDEAVRLLRNAASLLDAGGTSPKPNLSPTAFAYNLAFFVVGCGLISIIFGSGGLAASLFVITMFISIRSVK